VLFVLVFVVGMLVIPVMIDAKQHGGVDIFRRSGQEVLQFQKVQALLRTSRISAERSANAVVGVVVGGVSLVFALVALYVSVTIFLWFLYLIKKMVF
jgi:hypothetical protein